MFDLILESKTQFIVVYRYVAVGGKENYESRLSINPQSGDMKIINKDDSGTEMFIRHAVLKLHSFFERNNYSAKEQVAWF